MTSAKPFLLTAANGRTGRALLSALSKKGHRVRVFIRDKTQFADLKALGAAEYATGDFLNPEDINAAMTGVGRALHIGPPMHPYELEISASLIRAAQDRGVEHFVYYSVMHPLRRDVRHHKLKLDTEQYLIESGLPYSILQPSRYMQHLLPIWPQIIKDGLHAMPFSIEKKFNLVDLQDLAEACAVVASSAEHLYATYELAGPQALSQQDMARIISNVIGREVEARQIPLDVMQQNAIAKGIDEDRVEQMRIMNKHYDQHGLLGNANILEYLLGRKATRFQAYVERLHKAGIS